MRKYIFLFLLLSVIKAEAQQNCPEGYEERTVKCNGQLIQKCVPITYSCKLCWVVDFPPCPGQKSGGVRFHNTYEGALAAAKKEANGNNWKNGVCTWYDNRSYTIYLDESKYCNTSSDDNLKSIAINDLKNKIGSFLKRYLDEIENYRRYLKGKPYKPGATVEEYERLLNQAEENAHSLSLKMNSIKDENFNQISQEFEDIKKDQITLRQAESNFKNSVEFSNSTNKNQPNASTTVNQDNYAKTVDGLNKIKQERDQRIEAGNNIVNMVGDILKEQQEQKRKEREERDKQEELAKQKRLEKKEEALEKVKMNIETNQKIAGVYYNNSLKKPLLVSEKVQNIYYVFWVRKDHDGIVYIFQPITLNKFNDDTWPAFIDLESKLKLILQKQGVEGALLNSYGYFIDYATAKKVFDDLKSNATTAGIKVKELSFQFTDKSVLDKNFWNN